MPPAVTSTNNKSSAPSAPTALEKNGHIYVTKTPEARGDAKDMDCLGGDHGIPAQQDLKDFIWTTTEEPHAARRKEMIKELGKEVTDLTGHEPLTKYIVVALLALHCGIGYYLREEALNGGTLKFWLITYLVGGTLAQILFLANHEVSHNLAFKSQLANKLFGIFTNMPMLVPYFIAFKDYHNEHHKLQGTDGVDTDLPTEFEAMLLSSVPGKLFFMFNQTWFYAFRPVFIKPQPFTLWHGVNLAVQVAFIYTVYNLFGMGPIWYFLGSAHCAGCHPLSAHFIAEHYTFNGLAETSSYYGWMNYLTWNVGFHNEHHDFPYVSWTRLPALRKVGAKWYNHIPYHKSWLYALYRFLMDPHVTLYNRVKRDPKKKE